MQVKLLRVVENREICRVGENTVRRVDFRLIAATNCDLLDEILRHRFRNDLYYRIKGWGLDVPPLRERVEDVYALANQLLADAASSLRRPILGYAAEALDRIRRYPWPGNVRELKNA